MATLAVDADKPKPDEQTYRRRVRSWALYDWANSAFVTTVIAAILPVYYSSVAGATLPSAATATAYWSLTNSIALLIVALLSPILGTISDLMRGKKTFLSMFVTIGIIGTGLLFFISTGDWLLASLFFIIGRVGFAGANVFYDSLLPHVAYEEDQDRVSSFGFALGYLGGGILLAINVIMLETIPDTWFDFAGIRLSFITVAIWWAVFSIPIFRNVPEPPAASIDKVPGDNIVVESFRSVGQLLKKIQRFPELFKYLIAFLIYNDGIGTIIGIAVIYGAELGFATLELILALLLVQFVGIPFSLIFGSLPNTNDSPRRPYHLAFIIYNAIALPLVGIIGANTLDISVTGRPPAPYVTAGQYVGEGLYSADAFTLTGDWETRTITSDEQTGTGILGALTRTFNPPDALTYIAGERGDTLTLPINGQAVELRYAIQPGGATVGFDADGVTVIETIDEIDTPLTLSTQDDTLRYGEITTITLPQAGQQDLTLRVLDGNLLIERIEVLPPTRSSNLGIIFGLLLATQAVGLVFALVCGRFFRPLADRMDTRRSILLSLMVYGMIAVWGYFLNASIEFWFLAWMVAVVQGGSQALSRSLYSYLCPATKSGEFFGLFSIMSKFASIIGPLLFASAVALFGSSRPAILSLIALFAIGGYLLTRVNIAEGHRAARAEDRRILGTEGEASA